MTRQFAPFVVAALVCVSSMLRAQPAQNDALLRYSRGEFEVIETIQTDKFEALRRDVKSSALSPQIKAAFLLEVFESLQRRIQLDAEFNDRAPYNGLIDASTAVEKMPATLPFVSAWRRAESAAMAHGWAGQSLVEWPWRLGAALSRRGTFDSQKRGNGDGLIPAEEVALDFALPLERFAWRGVFQDRRAFIVAEQREFREFVEKQGWPLVEGLEADALKRALAALADAETVAAARPEALMRRAALLAASSRAAEALPLFDESLQLTRDNWVAYLDHLLKGRALETLDRAAEAEASYRAALALSPKARSAHLALAALAFARGVRADDHLMAALGPDADRLDPWAQMLDGSYRFWPERRDMLRRTMR